jgi:DeoR/GlpR family transcriptional regulator of sugar metabolism
LIGKGELTIITKANYVFDTLELETEITLISTGSVLRQVTQVLVGPTAEGSLRDLRAEGSITIIVRESGGFYEQVAST